MQQHLVLRTLKGKDANALQRFILENEGRFRVPFPLTTEGILQDPRKWIKQKHKDFLKNKSIVLTIAEEETNQMICCTLAFGFDWRSGKCELAWMTDKSYEGRGLQYTSLQALIHYLFSWCNVNKVVCRIVPGNESSIRLAEKVGFVREGHHLKDFRDGTGALVDVYYYGLCRKETH